MAEAPSDAVHRSRDVRRADLMTSAQQMIIRALAYAYPCTAEYHPFTAISPSPRGRKDEKDA